MTQNEPMTPETAEEIQEEIREEAQVGEQETNQEQTPETQVDPNLKAALEAAEKYEQIKDQHLRLMAEFDNYRKRTTKEKEQSFERGQRCVVEAMLPVIDNLERAIAAGGREEDPFAKGVQMTYDQMIKALNQMGVEQLEDVGKTFDPNFHEAMMRVDDENFKEDEIVAVLRKGYTMNGALLRASLVKVAN
ncbi:MAG: nucleotide exchange factor GrpE [Lachnospiraceae bacterium]|nr:nucleotide exchange factor GrpE [Lachnospiraceae bacterium]